MSYLRFAAIRNECKQNVQKLAMAINGKYISLTIKYCFKIFEVIPTREELLLLDV